VRKPVDNCIQLRITGAVLWIKKNISFIGSYRLRLMLAEE